MNQQSDLQHTVFMTAMRLWDSRNAHLKADTPHGLDCQGEYWLIRNKPAMKAFCRACATYETASKVHK